VNGFRAWISRPVNASIIGAAMLLLILIAWRWPTALMAGYLAAWSFWLGVPLGTLGILLIHRLTGGHWGEGLLDQSPSVLRSLPGLGLLLIPVMLGMKFIYPWTHGHAANEDAAFQHWYLSLGPFVTRTVIYFLIWQALAWVATNPASRFAGPGLLLTVITISFASLDWLASVSADFVSTMFGLYVLVSYGLTALCVLLLSALTRREDWSAKQLNDWGNFLLTIVMMHGYLAFSQFLIIWSGNLPREAKWYVERMHGTWGGAAILLIIFQLFLPLFVLLFRSVKRNPAMLGATAGVVLLMQWIESAWVVLPSMAEWNGTAAHTVIALGVMVVATAGLGLLLLPVWGVIARPMPLEKPEVSR